MPRTDTDLHVPPIDPELQAALDAAGISTVAVGITADTIVDERAAVDALTPSYDEIAADPRFTVDERTVPGPPDNPRLTVLVARPADARSGTPVLVTQHGGGLITGTSRFGLPDTLDLAADLGAAVVSAEYRLAPEHPHPAAHDDAWAALVWTAANASAIGARADALILHGGSAGGNLAAGLALRARDTGAVDVRGLLLLYPMLDDRTATVSAHRMQGRGVWDATSNRTAWAAVLAGRAPTPYAAPARAEDLSGLPPVYLEVGSAETFRDETVDWAQRLWADGGDAELHVWPGAVHGFELFAPGSVLARRARTARREWAQRVLGPA
ncbi:alpha/beta hydrolase [Pseudonocardia phyllosphaerae]|uniref:alpha/beta hydrolase n=1 Tax=Pseudonocardia phyllosphaerae TaxID=3390502 RepID=UPI0039780314